MNVRNRKNLQTERSAISLSSKSPSQQRAKSMGSTREKDQTISLPHQPLLSSLVVRPSSTELGAGSGGGGANVGGSGGGGRGSDYEPGEVTRDPHPPPYSRSHRYSDDPGYRIRAGSGSPVHRSGAEHRYGSDYNHSGGLPRNREFSGGRDLGRYRDLSPPYNRGRVGERPMGRAYDGPGIGSRPLRGEGLSRNNPNVRPREGDWICTDPSCGNLNFARRENCNNCHRSRYAPAGSPRRGYGGPPSHAPPRHFPGRSIDRSPDRALNGYRSPPRGWARNGPRELGTPSLPPLRNEGRFPDHHMRRDQMDYLEDDYRGRNKFDRPLPMDWSHRDRAREGFPGGRDGFVGERRGFDRRPLSPPFPPPPALPPLRERWSRDVRERSRSPIRGGSPGSNRRDLYVEGGRDDRRGMGRDRVGGVY